MDNINVVKEIIKEQSLIIGEQLAKQRAIDSGVVQFNSSRIEDISITETDPHTVITQVIKSYEVLFGPASVEVCIDVIKRVSPENISLAQSFSKIR